jgi:MFS family permease
MSLFSMVLVGMAPFGSLAAGTLADRFGARLVVATGGLCCAAAAMWFARMLPRLRAVAIPVLIRRGIIPDPAAAVETSVGAVITADEIETRDTSVAASRLD